MAVKNREIFDDVVMDIPIVSAVIGDGLNRAQDFDVADFNVVDFVIAVDQVSGKNSGSKGIKIAV
ncbi:MAG: hypothetical protein HYT79_05105 [Elusimicrobia bacterium]|nr:hypothetical protein [Elusimicrobiota bacterium]